MSSSVCAKPSSSKQATKRDAVVIWGIDLSGSMSGRIEMVAKQLESGLSEIQADDSDVAEIGNLLFSSSVSYWPEPNVFSTLPVEEYPGLSKEALQEAGQFQSTSLVDALVDGVEKLSEVLL